MSPSCIFCQIVSGAAPASIVYRDELCTCFMDIQPVNAGHVLIVPNRHATNLQEMPEETVAHLFRMAQRLGAALRRTDLRCEGVNLSLADGEAAGQEVFHVHLHVFPRYRGDGFGLRFGPNYTTKPPRDQLDAAAARIAAAMQ